jgi:hypothetical protein
LVYLTTSTKNSDQRRMLSPSITQLQSNNGYTIVSRKKGRPLSRNISRSVLKPAYRANSRQPIHDYMLQVLTNNNAAIILLSFIQ